MGSWQEQGMHKLKELIADRELFTALLLILVATASFGLGRQSTIPKTTNSNQATAIAAKNNPVVVQNEKLSTDTYFVASKNGEAYHLPFCSGAKRISEKNKITFATKEAAEAAGYRPAANCPGL